MADSALCLVKWRSPSGNGRTYRLFEHEAGVRSYLADSPRLNRCGDCDALGATPPGRGGPGRADAVVVRDRRGRRARGRGSPSYYQRAHFDASREGSLPRAGRCHTDRAFRAAAATGSHRGTPGAPPYSDSGRAARAVCAGARGCARRSRKARDSAPVLQHTDDGKGQRARPQPRTRTRTREEGAGHSAVCASRSSEGQRRRAAAR
jgi:hypothetical protein